MLSVLEAHVHVCVEASRSVGSKVLFAGTSVVVAAEETKRTEQGRVKKRCILLCSPRSILTNH